MLSRCKIRAALSWSGSEHKSQRESVVSPMWSRNFFNGTLLSRKVVMIRRFLRFRELKKSKKSV